MSTREKSPEPPSPRRKHPTDEEARFFGTEGERTGDGHQAARGPAATAPEQRRREAEATMREDVVDTETPPDVAPTDDRSESRAEPVTEPTGGRAALFKPEQAESLRARWDAIQTEFVDEPRTAVEKADALVGDVMQRLADGFRDERTRLEREWDRGDSVSTEDLRVALKRYRTFFDRLLSV